MTFTISLPRLAQRPQSDDDDYYKPNYQDAVSCLFKEDYQSLNLKPDCAHRPLWVCHDGRIILETFSPLFMQAQDFLITISEPVTRPSRIHEFKLTSYSLYAAVSVGMTTNVILEVLDRFSKVKLPEKIVAFIKEFTLSYGKVKLVLKRNRYFIESSFPEMIRVLLHDKIIRDARVIREDAPVKPEEVVVKGEDEFGAVITLDGDDEDDNQNEGKLAALADESDFTSSFEIQTDLVESVKKRCTDLDYPLMEEYDFRQDTINENLEIDLSPKTVIRDYQEKSLSKMFGGGSSGGRARSGIIVLPTGAGKTLVGITAACTVKKSTIILCTNALSVEQWANELKKWSTIQEDQIAKFTANSKEKFAGKAGIVISTYTMISHSGKRAMDTQAMISFVNNHEWGLMILDEVHVVPANVFRKVLSTVAAHTKLGLTATLVREDDKIEDLNFLIGPKLYEANWMDLASRGHIAKVEATEIWCPMTGNFYQEYLKSRSGKRRLLCAVNPTKFMAAEYLIRWREKEGDKIIVFSDNVFALMHYAITMKKPFIYGATSHEERSRILDRFRKGHEQFRTIFLSKVGDTSLDLPEATCLIQISSQFGSRRQEAQRMGRILRAKRRNEEGFRSRFYTLVSRDTDEVQFSARRRTFLVDQGYEFHVIPNFETLVPQEEFPTLHYYTTREQNELLALVKQQNDEVGQDEIVETSVDDLAGEWQSQMLARRNGPSKNKGGVGKSAGPQKERKQHSLFKAFRKK
ncbi:P-loop containing nucleoside triphosphate hydrolase protein [Globomyces pollinis-pini]|nr:P-loop containing nucleoside triphosphate hydrolase protein [Globomyces pollinis-pini]